MPRLKKKKTIHLATKTQLDPRKTFECGQCFRWTADAHGVYTGMAAGRAAKVFTAGDEVLLTCDASWDDDFWTDYFDLETNYEAINFGPGVNGYFRDCMDYGRGIRILRQEKWEALCSFILSQCNNIPRIRGIIDRLCRLYGEPVDFQGETLYTFPGPEKLAGLSPENLAPIRSGYRAAYIISAAKAVAEGDVDLEALAFSDRETAVRALTRLHGVGEKVANCVALFGLHIMSGFPMDVWMKRAIKRHFPKDFHPESLGPCAGLAQQYIFFYERESKGAG